MMLTDDIYEQEVVQDSVMLITLVYRLSSICQDF